MAASPPLFRAAVPGTSIALRHRPPASLTTNACSWPKARYCPPAAQPPAAAHDTERMAAAPPLFRAAMPGTSIALSQPPATADGTPATAGPAPASSTQPNPATATPVTPGLRTRLINPTSTTAAAHEAGPARHAASQYSHHAAARAIALSTREHPFRSTGRSSTPLPHLTSVNRCMRHAAIGADTSYQRPASNAGCRLLTFLETAAPRCEGCRMSSSEPSSGSCWISRCRAYRAVFARLSRCLRARSVITAALESCSVVLMALACRVSSRVHLLGLEAGRPRCGV